MCDIISYFRTDRRLSCNREKYVSVEKMLRKLSQVTCWHEATNMPLKPSVAVSMRKWLVNLIGTQIVNLMRLKPRTRTRTRTQDCPWTTIRNKQSASWLRTDNSAYLPLVTHAMHKVGTKTNTINCTEKNRSANFRIYGFQPGANDEIRNNIALAQHPIVSRSPPFNR